MQCFVYRSARKEGLYIYLPQEDDFSELPETLLTLAGDLQLALEFELTPERKLQREDATAVMANLKGQGYHVQMPETVESRVNTLHNAEP